MWDKWVLASVAVILLAIAAGALSLLRRAPAQLPSKAEPAAPPREASLPARIRARHMIAVGAQVTGTIEGFLADVGQEVYEGQVLARIANQELEATRDAAAREAENVQSRVNSLESALIAARLEASQRRADASRSRDELKRTETSYRRQQMLHREGATPRLVFEKSQHEFDTADAEYRSLSELARQAEERAAKALQDLESARRSLEERNKELEQAQTILSDAEIRSPASGLVISRKGEAGKQIGPDDAKQMFQLAVDLNLLEAVLEPEPPLLKRIKPGAPALIVTADLPGEGIAANITAIRNREIIVEFSSPSPAVRPGVTAEVRVRLE